MAMSTGKTEQPPAKLPGGTDYIPKIMIVDDDEAHLQFIRMVILKENFTCDLTLCNNALQALEIIRQSPPDLLLLDVMMPKMDGFQVIGRLRKDPVTKDLPVIFLTSSQETDHVVRAYEAGAVDFISKPINSAVLAVRIQALLQRIILENELKLRNQELLQINRYKDELLSVCSHDLRAPLAAIEVICRSLRESPPDAAGAGNGPLVDRILNQSRLARRLVDNLLDYDKLEEGMLLPASSFFQVRDFLVACAEQEEPIIQARGLAFQMELPGEDVLLFGDHELTAQAVRNVLGNAVNYAGSTISLVARVEEMTPREGGLLCIEISDDGPGIDPDKREEIFSKYTKIDPSAGGSGLGLYIASRVVELHAGKIAVTAAPGWATTFRLALPNAYLRDQLPDLSELSEARGLVISSSRTTGQLLEGLLLEAGLVYITGETTDAFGPEAFSGEPPRFAFVDLEAAETNFFKLAKTIGQAPKGIAWTFYGHPNRLETLQKLINVPHSHLPAPLNPLVLLNLMTELLSGDRIEMTR
jgi:two-component system sensor histidine kinase/response regulator